MNLKRSRRSVRPWYAILLAAIAAAVITFGITQLGTPTSSAARTSTEDVTAADGVVQTTVSGSGEVEPGVDDTLNFGTSGTLKSVDVKVGQRVKRGQLIATLDRSSAALTLEEARASLTAAEDNLTEVEDGSSTGSSATGTSSNGANSTDGSAASASAASVTASVASVLRPADSGTTDTSTATTPAATSTYPTTTTSPAATTTDTTTTTSTVPTTATSTTPTTSATKTTKTTPATTRTTPATKTTPASGKTPTAAKTTATKRVAGGSGSSSGAKVKTTPVDSTAKRTVTTTATTTKTKPTAAEIQQAEVQVDEAKATVTADQKQLRETRLYAPAAGTIATLSSDSIGQSVSSGSDSSSAASASSASSSATAASGTGGSSSTSGFATLVNDRTMTMSVSISEDDISSVKVGQIATLSITALSGIELAGHVSSISPIGSDSSGVVSYDVTVTVTQSNAKVLPGMSATAAIVTGQAQGVTVSNQAISGSGSNASVELVKNGKTVSTPVVVGLKGSSRSQIVSGLRPGDQVQVTITLPSLGTSTTSSSSSSSSSGFGSRFGGAGGFPGGGTGGGSAIRAFFAGGGGAG